MNNKVVELFPAFDLSKGTFSNRLPEHRTGEEMMRDLRDAVAKIKRMKIHLVEDHHELQE